MYTLVTSTYVTHTRIIFISFIHYFMYVIYTINTLFTCLKLFFNVLMITYALIWFHIHLLILYIHKKCTYVKNERVTLLRSFSLIAAGSGPY